MSKLAISVYYIGKSYFNLFPFIYIFTLLRGVSITSVFHITGILSIAFLISNMLWWFGQH